MAKRKRIKKAVLFVFLSVLLLSVIAAAVILFSAFKREDLPPDNEVLSVRFFDVGQGDSILLRSPEGKYMLIDTGTNSGEKKLISDLEKCGVKTLEYLVLTHPHEDHIGGADKVLEKFKVKTLLSPDVGADTEAFRNLLAAIEKSDCADIQPPVGREYTFFEDCTFTVLGPADTDETLNNCSLVLRLTYKDTAFLFMGDAEKEEETAILSRFKDDLSADVLKVGHHGSSTASSDSFLDAAKPSVAVISCGKGNDYGHPHQSTLRRLKDRNVKICRTDLSGTVKIVSDGEKIYVENNEQ